MNRMQTYRIETARLVLRPYDITDHLRMDKAVRASLPDLVEWLPWSRREPIPSEERIALLEKFRGDYLQGIDFTLGIFNKEETELLGSTGLHTRHDKEGVGFDNTTREIGYWISSLHHRKGYAQEAVRALVSVGFGVEGLSRIIIKCATGNYASCAIPEKLGFRLTGTIAAGTPGTSGHPLLVWELTKEDAALRGIRDPALKAFDRQGNLLPLS